MEFLIKPRFRALRNALFFETERLNALARAEYSDKFGFYQRQFGVYAYMNLTSDLTFRIHYAQGTPFMWQPHNNCAWTPTGTLSMGQMEITPCKAKVNEQYCYDEFIESTYKAALQWSSNPTIGFSQMGVEANNELVRTILKNATLGARMTLVGGQLIDLTSTTFETGVSSRIEDAYRRTAGTCRGWIELLRDTATETGKEHLDGGATNFIDAADISSDGTTYLGTTNTVVELYDIIRAGAPAELQDAIIEGGVGGFGEMFQPLYLVSPSIYRALDADWIAQKTSPLVNEQRISRRPFEINTERGPRTIYAYFIDDTAVVPVSEISHFDRYVTGTSHFAYVTISGVIQLGASFADLPRVNESEVAVMIQVSEDAEDYGTSKFLSHNLMATAINDTNYIAGEYVYAEPA